MAVIKTLKENGRKIYPITSSECVFTPEGKTVDALITEKVRELPERIGKVEDDVTDLGHEVGKVEKSAEELKKENAELKEDLAELEAVALVDSEMKYGQPRVLYGAGTPQEAIVPDNWVGIDKGGCYWNGQPLFVGQVYININATSNGRYTGVRNANYGDIVWKNF